jgi:CHAT domain-containing protein/tetratricopeptide (TPR) repeat protein
MTVRPTRPFILRRGLGLALAGALVIWGPGAGRLIAQGADPDPRKTAFEAFQKGVALVNAGKPAEALAAFEKALPLIESAEGKDSLGVGAALAYMGRLHHAAGRNAQAEPLYRRCLAIYEARSGPTHLDTATGLGDLGLILFDMGQLAEAEKLFRRCLAIQESRLGKEDPETARTTGNLALLLGAAGRFHEAEMLYRRTLEVLEAKLGKDHPETALVLHNLGTAYRDLGRPADAVPLFRRALTVFEAKLGPTHAQTGRALNNLAVAYQSLGRDADAEPLLKRSLEVLEKQLGPDHAHTAFARNNLGWLYARLGRPADAERYHRAALRTRLQVLGPDHPDTAQSLNNLALVCEETGRADEARDLIGRAAAAFEKSLGVEHPSTATALGNQGRQVARDRPADAVPLFDRQARGLRRFLATELPGRAESEQLGFLEHVFRGRLEQSLSLALPARFGEASAEWLANGKGLSLESLARRALLARELDRPATGVTAGRLQVTRRKLSALALAPVPAGGEADRRRQLDALTREEAALARELTEKAGLPLASDPWVGLDAVRRALPADGVLVDIAHFRPFRFTAGPKEAAWGRPRYVAWVVRPAGPGITPVTVIDLGPADAIDAAVRGLRTGLGGTPGRLQGTDETAYRRAAEPLARLVLHPVLPAVGKAGRLLLSPDAALHLVPWAALPLPDGGYALDRFTIRYLNAGREAVPGRALPAETGPVVFADPAFAAPRPGTPGDGELAALTRSAGLSGRLPRTFARLPGTAAEAAAIVPILTKAAGRQPTRYTGAGATVEAFRGLRRPRLLVLATHGYFLPAAAGRPAAPPSALADWRAGPPVDPQANPMLRCGLVLAGANDRGESSAGLLTGYDILAADLRGCELVVLSACETAVGDLSSGEGVAGLRQAFQLAGARAVLASLWQVSDAATALLMTRFHENWLGQRAGLPKPMSKAEALREAQRWLQTLTRRDAQDRLAGVPEAGRGLTLEPSAGPGAADDRPFAHPFYWSAFVLLGDAD